MQRSRSFECNAREKKANKEKVTKKKLIKKKVLSQSPYNIPLKGQEGQDRTLKII